MKPLVSVVIPAHNGENYLGEAIQSILNQTYSTYEIWVIDNGSTDRTKEVACAFPEVQYRGTEKADAAVARHQGVALSRGEYITFLDQDDQWTEEKLAKQVEFLESNPHYGAVIGLQQMFLEPGHLKPHWLKQVYLEKPELAYLPSALMVRRSTFAVTDNFNTDFPLASDVAWFFKAHHSGVPIGILQEVIVHRRIHGDNMSNKHIALQKEILSTIKHSLQERRK